MHPSRAFGVAAAAALLSSVVLVRADHPAGVIIPFEVVNKNIFLSVAVGQSRAVPFMLDTGAKPAVIDLATAKALGLELGDAVDVVGAGERVITGHLLRNGAFRLPELDGFSQPLAIAIPLDDLAHASGHAFAGILGFDFISRFVVTIDYERRRLTLRDPSGYTYRGAGAVLPLTFNAAGHPVVHAQIRDGRRAPIDGVFVVDTGSGAAVILNAPFVARERLLTSDRPTFPWLAGRALGGRVGGSVGRITGMTIGGFALDDPIAVFSKTTSGAFAGTDVQGNIGAAILEKFTVTLDYTRSRMFLEPNARFGQRMPFNYTGMSFAAEGDGFRTIRVDRVEEGSPAAESGLRAGDVLLTIDGVPAAEYTLSEWRERLSAASSARFSVKRGEERLTMTVNPSALQ